MEVDMPMDQMPIEHMAWEAKIGSCDSSSSDDDEEEVTTAIRKTYDETATKLTEERVGVNDKLMNGSWLDRIAWNGEEVEEIDLTRSRAVPWILCRASKQIDNSNRMDIEEEDQEEEKVSPRRRHLQSSKRVLPAIYRHARPAVLHRFMIADPSPSAMLRFHRPRLAKSFLNEAWRCLVAKPHELSPAREDTLKEVESWELRSSEGELLCLEYSEEQPPIVANPGMTSTVVTISRSGTQTGDPEFGSYVDIDAEHDDDLLFGADEEGDIALCNNLFRAPIYFHDASHTFLLVLKPREDNTRTTKNNATTKHIFSLRRIPRLAVCGQIEPRRAVPNLDSHMYLRLQEPIAAFAVARTFGALEQHKNHQVRAMLVTTNEVGEAIFKNAGLKTALLRRILRVSAKSTRGPKNADMWGPRPREEINTNDAKPNATPPDSTRKDDQHIVKFDGGVNYIEADRLAPNITPEDVCCYEAANAFGARLHHLGLSGIISRKEAVYACSILHKRSLAARKRYEVLNARARGAVSNASRLSASASDKTSECGPTLTEIANVALGRARRLERTLACARLIHEELTWSPTALTSAYVEAHVRHNPKAAIRVAGLGDPSGRGEALSLIKGTLTEYKKLGRPSLSQSERAGRTARNRAEYLARIRQVCARQRKALSGSATDVHRENDVDEDHVHAEDIDFAAEARIRRMVQRRANAHSPTPASSGTAAKSPTQDTEATNAEKKGGTDSDAELSDLEKDLEDELMDHDEDEDNHGGRRTSKGPSAASDARALEQLRKDMAARAAQEASQSIQKEHVELPSYAVRRVTRVYDEVEGREKMVVSFDIRRNELERVAKKTGFLLDSMSHEDETKEEKAPPDDDLLFADLDYLDEESIFDLMDSTNDGPGDFDGPTADQPRRRTGPPDAKRPLFKFSNSINESPPQKRKPSGRKPSGPRRKRDEAPQADGSSSVKLNFSKIQRAHNEHKQKLKKQKVEQHKAEAASYHRRTGGTGGRRGAAVPRRQRGSGAAHRAKPHVQMAKLLDDAVILPAMRRPGSGPFLAPVNTKLYQSYRQKVSQPMDLATIRERLTRRYRYRDRNSLITDLRLIAENSAAFNGDQNPITLEARALVDHALASIDAISDQLDLLEAENKRAAEDASSRRPKPAKAPNKYKPKARNSSQPASTTTVVQQNTTILEEEDEVIEDVVLPDQDEEVVEEGVVLDEDGDAHMSGQDGIDEVEEEVIEEEGQLDSDDSDDNDEDDAAQDNDNNEVDPLAEELAS